MNDKDMSSAYEFIREYLTGNEKTMDGKMFIFSLATALPAIEKQIPKKPGDDLNEAWCPSCHSILEYEALYCDRCGQKLLWED